MADFAKLLGEKMAKAAGANRAPTPEAEAKPSGQGSPFSAPRGGQSS